jgi:hypothetical protein
MGIGDAGTGINLVGLVLTSGMSAKHHPSITQAESLPTMKPMIMTQSIGNR